MVLHTLNASPLQPAFAQCLRVLGAKDALLLLGDGVYAALAGPELLAQLQTLDVAVFVLEPDARAAGLSELPGGLSPIDYDGFVALSEQFPRQQAWY